MRFSIPLIIFDLKIFVKLCFVLACLLIAFPAISQNPFLSAKIYGENSALFKSNAKHIAQDGFGFTWIGTDRGLSRFDGVSFVNYLTDPKDSTSLANERINALAAHPTNGQIWTGHDQGLSIYLPEQNNFKNIVYGEKSKKGLPAGRIENIFIDPKGQSWINMQNQGLWKYNTLAEAFEEIVITKRVAPSKYSPALAGTKFLQDLIDENIIWVSNYRGLAKLNKNQKTITYIENIPFDSDLARVFATTQLSNGDLLLGIREKGMYYFDRKTEAYIPFGECSINIIDWSKYFNLFPHSDNKFWIFQKEKMHLVKLNSNCYELIETHPIGRRAHPIYADKENRIWFSNFSKGLMISNPKNTPTLKKVVFPIDTKKAYSPGSRNILYDKKNNLIFCVGSQLDGLNIHHLDNNQIEVVSAPDEYNAGKDKALSGNNIFFDKDNTLYLKSGRGDFKYQLGKKRLSPVEGKTPLPHKKGNGYYVYGQDGTLWKNESYGFGFYKAGVSKNLNLNKKMSEFEPGRYKDGKVIEDKNGNIWILASKGIFVYLTKTEEFKFFKFDVRLAKRAVPKKGDLLLDQQGMLWFTIDQRYLGHFDPNNLEKGKIQYFGQEDGLHDKRISSFRLYRDKLMIFTQTGFQFFNPQAKQFESFHGLASNFNDPIWHSIALPDGQIAGMSSDGILYFRPEDFNKENTAPKPYLNYLSVEGIERPFNQIYQPDGALNFKADEDDFVLGFSALGYMHSGTQQFRYQLRGYDEVWKTAKANDRLHYQKVPGGNYEFILEPMNEQGFPHSTVSLCAINISPPWWQHTWFYSLAISLVLGTLLLIYKIRINRVRKEERLRAQFQKELAEVEMTALRAQMNPHFIFNSLNSIDYYIICQDKETASDYLNRFSRLIRLVLQNSKMEKVSLQSDLEALRLYIELEQLRFEKKFDFEIKIDPRIDIEHTVVPPLLIQPYVENAIWHGLMQHKGVKGQLKILLYRENDFIICQIEDNGIGRKASRALHSKTGAEHKSFGMKITSDRLALINAKDGSKASVEVFDLQHDDGRAAGTLVDLEIPIH